MKKEEKNVTTNKSTMKEFRRAKTLVYHNNEKRENDIVKIVAESEKSYKTEDNKYIKKSDLENVTMLRNSIDNRFIVDDDDNKYNLIHDKLCVVLEISKKTDIRYFNSLFNVKEMRKSFNIMNSDSVILNRANAIELLIVESDREKLQSLIDKLTANSKEDDAKKIFRQLDAILDKSLHDKFLRHIKTTENIYSLVLKTKEDILKASTLLK